MTGFVSFWLFGLYLKKTWSEDISEVKVQNEKFSFEAKRNEIGVWHIKSDNQESLWFAFGYLQAHDREFQTELYRHYALGQLTEWFGEKALPKDRLMRAFAKHSREEWDKIPNNSIVKAASQAYVDGRNYWLDQTQQTTPVEYKLFQIERKDLTRWEAWQIVAISRLHAWEHSFDVHNETRYLAMQAQLGKKLADALSIKNQSKEGVLYNQDSVKSNIKKLSALGPNTWEDSQSAKNTYSTVKLEKKQDITTASTLNFNPLESLLGADELGASNAWIVADPRAKTAPTLCNDTHLRFTWPAPFFPISYEIPNLVKAKGYMLSASPILVIGEVHNIPKNNSLTWGITLAGFADTQDLIKLSPSSLNNSKKREENYKINNLLEGTTSEIKITEEWTAYGPRVDSFLELFGFEIKEALALDWIGARFSKSPLEFFLNRNILGPENLKNDFNNHWQFPSVNFTWIENQGPKNMFGHILTGNIFSRSRSVDYIPLPENKVSLRTISEAKERPYFEKSYDGSSFLMATANQAIFSDNSLNSKLGDDWIPPTRVNGILNQKDKLVFNPEYSQTDRHSKVLTKWLVQLKNIDTDKICKKFADKSKNCLDVLGDLKNWDGNALKESWQPTLSSLWFENFKLQIWTPQKVLGNKNIENLFGSWTRSYPADNLVMQGSTSENLIMGGYLDNPKWINIIESETHQNIKNMLKSSLEESLTRLSENFGWDLKKWQWGNFHNMDWAHPFAQLPPPFNKFLLESLLGPPRPVPGAWDSPGVFHYSWSPSETLNFPAGYGAVMRFCSTPQMKNFRWTMSTGVSGNPFSKWGWKMANEYFFKDKLYPDNN